MPLNKQTLNINFAQGLDTKTDPFQVQPGKFLTLENSIFDKAGRLTKRNGFGSLTTLPNPNAKYIATFNGNLTAIGSTLDAFSDATQTWVTKASFNPISLKTLPLIQNNFNQVQADTAIASNGLVCIVYSSETPSGTIYQYAVSDSITGQSLVAPTALSNASASFGYPKVFILGNYFFIIYTATVGGIQHLQYKAININNPLNVTASVDISTQYTPHATGAFDAYVVNNNIYIAWNASDAGGAIRMKYITSTLAQSSDIIFTGSQNVAQYMSVTADQSGSTPVIWVSYHNSTTGHSFAVNPNLVVVVAPHSVIISTNLINLTSSAVNGVNTIIYEVHNTYSYDSSIATDYIQSVSINLAGSVTLAVTIVRSVGLASKAIEINGQFFFLGIYQSDFQPSYFLLNQNGQVISKLAYSNGADYYIFGLPNLSLNNSVLQVPYLFKDLLQAINRTQGVANTAGVYSQLGISLASFSQESQLTTAEIGNNLNLSGGLLWSYDGFQLVENGFFLFPDYVETAVVLSGGAIADATYFYQVTYEWSDNQGNIFRSAPSIPVTAVVTGGAGAASIDLNIPTLRLTYKTQNPVKIVIYRWSTNQQIYYQVTSITMPLLNSLTTDSVIYIDTQDDASILGNNILYTTGGVIENLSPPATDLITLFNNRLWLVDSEDRNLLWFSKQVIEATPVEMSDLLTMYIAPTTASEGSTGPITALAPMDDKLIVFKQNAMGYINGIGPDNTGANNGYSDFTLITSVVGCTNQNSIVFTPAGLMFQSNKGLWILGRDLSTQYIGAPVESLTQGSLVKNALNIPSTNQVRFTLDNGTTLMYDYYFAQWGTFTKVPAISSTIFQNLHTYVNSIGRVFQETDGLYLDDTSPVLMNFTTNWMNLAGVQGYERFYQMYLLGEYISPFKLNVQLAYDYNSSATQATIVKPMPRGPNWGGLPLWGSSPNWGGQSQVFEARVFPTKQKCESFQISISEIYDSTQGLMPGAGLTLSGLNLVTGMKKGYRVQSAAKSFG